MTSLIAAFRAAVLGDRAPGVRSRCGRPSVAVLAGCLYFRRVEDSFADIV